MERVGNHTTVEEIERMDREGRIVRNLRSAPLKDTVTVPDGGFTILRFIADNPGMLPNIIFYRYIFKTSKINYTNRLLVIPLSY